MTSLLHLNVPGDPVPQPRPRARQTGWGTRVYKDANHPVHAYKDSIALLASQKVRELITGPLDIRLTFIMSRPNSKRWVRKPMVREWDARHNGDWDNLSKAVCDALEGVAYKNDQQIVAGTFKKILAAGHEGSCTIIDLFRADSDFC